MRMHFKENISFSVIVDGSVLGGAGISVADKRFLCRISVFFVNKNIYIAHQSALWNRVIFFYYCTLEKYMADFSAVEYIINILNCFFLAFIKVNTAEKIFACGKSAFFRNSRRVFSCIKNRESNGNQIMRLCFHAEQGIIDILCHRHLFSVEKSVCHFN